VPLSLQWVECKRLFQEAADLMDYDRKKLKTMWGQFWAAHQVSLHSVWRPLEYTCTSSALSVFIHYIIMCM